MAPTMVLGATTASAEPLTATKALPTVAVGRASAIPTGAQRAPLPASVPVTVVLASAHASALRTYALAVSTPGNPRYRHFLSSTQVRAQFGASPATLTAVRRWLGSAGMTVGPPSAGNLVLTATGPPATMSAAFRTTLTAYTTSSGQSRYGAATAPRVPAALAPVIQSVLGLGGEPSPSVAAIQTPAISAATPGVSATPVAASTQSASHRSPVPKACAAAQQAASATYDLPIGPSHGTTAPQVATALGMSSLYGRGDLGLGVTVAVVTGGGDYADSDISFYRDCYGTHNQVTRVRIDGGYLGAQTLDDTEVTMDIETVMGLAPRANLRVYEAPYFSPTFVLDDLAAIAQDNLAQVVTISYAACENQAAGDDPAAENLVLQVMAVQGQTLLAASGDQGSQACVGQNALAGQNDFTGTFLSQLVVSDPASQPFATAVGGAYLPDLTDPASATVWNNGPFSSYQGNTATGGGLSQTWAMPTWQQKTKGNTNNLPAACGLTGTSPCREVPDVAGLADPRNGEVIYCTSTQCRQLEAKFPGSPPGWFLADGTSFATPQWAALVALADQGVPGRRVGLITPRLYQMAAGPGSVRPRATGEQHLPDHQQRLQGAQPHLLLRLGQGVGTLLSGHGRLQPGHRPGPARRLGARPSATRLGLTERSVWGAG
ncbi:MAG TPA: protease pro-enzyme activation domain-containing protein [Acidimicrobiales bacterium]|nr:protease pro-enzyme activation domain-containing protein [Acidimicrobiales bacterium]